MNAQIGFTSSRQPDHIWVVEINARTYRFTKSNERIGVFLYKCQLGAGNDGPYRSFYSDRDLTRLEVEQLRQFAELTSE